MKKRPLSAIAPLLIVVFSYTTVLAQAPAGSHTLREKKNLALDEKLLRVFETGDIAELDGILAPNFVNHSAMGDRVGIDSTKAMVQLFHARGAHIKMEIKRRWADDEYVSDWISYATGAASAIEGIEVTRYANGKAVEHWFFPNGQTTKR